MKLKSQNRYRRPRKPFIFILSIIFTLSIYSLESFKKPYRASTQIPNYNTTYGTYSLARTMLYSNSLMEQDLFTYSFNGTYNGRFRIYYTANAYNHIQSINFINCYVESKTGTYIQIAFKNQSEIAIIFTNDSAYPMDITSVSDYNMTKIADGVSSQLETLQTIFYSVQTAINAINTNSSSINTNVSDIETLIRNYFTTSSGTTVNIGDIILQFNEFNAQLQLQLGILNDLKSALLDIDNKIDMITWTNHTQYNFQKTNSVGGTLSNFAADVSLGNTVYVYIPTTIILNNDYLYHFHFPIYTSNYNNFEITAEIYDSSGYKVNGMTYVEVRNSRNIDVYVHPELTSSGRANYIKITCSVVMYGNNYGENSSFYEMLSANDIEYYDLMQYFTNYNYHKNVLNYLNVIASKDYNNKLDDIISAINNISFTLDSDTVNDTEIIIDNYNDIYTDIEGIEIQFINDFNSQNNNIDKTIFDRQVNITNAKNAVETVIGQFMTNDYIKGIVYLFLLTIIVIAIMG